MGVRLLLWRWDTVEQEVSEGSVDLGVLEIRWREQYDRI